MDQSRKSSLFILREYLRVDDNHMLPECRTRSAENESDGLQRIHVTNDVGPAKYRR